MSFYKNIVAELDSIADMVQKQGQSKIAARIDQVSNSLEIQGRKAFKRKADQSEGLSMPSQGNGGVEANPGSLDADESFWSDSFTADNYHKIPVGQQSMQKAVHGGTGAADMLDRLNIAEEGEVNVQASKRRKKKASDDSSNFDEGDPMDPFSTAGLPETGDESSQPPVDANQEGDVLEFWGQEPGGSLHMPGGERAAKARAILRKAADIVVEDDPHTSGPGEDVERDQSLGGRTETAMDEDEMDDHMDDVEEVVEDEVEDEMEDHEEEMHEDEMEDDDDDGEEAGMYANMEYASRKQARKTLQMARQKQRQASRRKSSGKAKKVRRKSR
jgi:hypothetical protein